MPDTVAKHDKRLPYEELARRAAIIVRQRGHRSLNAACKAVGANWMTVYRALRLGLTPRTTPTVKSQLREIGILDLAIRGR